MWICLDDRYLVDIDAFTHVYVSGNFLKVTNTLLVMEDIDTRITHIIAEYATNAEAVRALKRIAVSLQRGDTVCYLSGGDPA